MVDENGVPIYEGYPHGTQHYEPPPAEIDSMPVHELADTAIPAELPANNPKLAPSPVYEKGSKAFSRSRSFDDMVGQKGLSVKKDDAETKSVGHASRPYGNDDTQDERRSI
ncbi:hypothetical protein KEM56_003525 [Ascosphaera pollenicola]|nr:hypothetical protein KEM56_003525 [Ascosphaera pollenicola]